MQLPPSLRLAIEETAQSITPSDLARAATELSSRYRTGQGNHGDYIGSEPLRIAYLATRMPATYAVLRSVFSELIELAPGIVIESLLDLGAGPGTSLWAAAETFDELKAATLYDSDTQLMSIGKSLAAGSKLPSLRNAEWLTGDIRSARLTPHQLVVCSYSLGELGRNQTLSVLRSAWEAAQTAIVIIEPGTVKGFGLIRELRESLIGMGAYLIAPCPHHDDCPMRTEDWCHFASRVERTSLHRYLKMGDRGYEDEKYSYLAATRQPERSATARVIRHPRRHSGFVEMTVCDGDGLKNLKITRSQKELWRKARKIEWGDGWE